MRTDALDTELARWKRLWTRQGKASSTVDQYQREVRAYAAWCAEKGLDIASLDSADEYVSEREKVSAGAARMTARGIKSYGTYLHAEYDTPSPFRRLSLPIEPEPTRAPMATQEDLERLLASCGRSWPDLRDAAIIVMLASTGMRRGECATIQRADLDLVAQTVLLRNTKSGKHRAVYLPEIVVGAIMRYEKAFDSYRAEGDDSLWLSTNSRPHVGLTAAGLGQMLARRGRETGVDVRAHAFRRWHASKWLMGGGSESALMANSGWTSQAMVSRYVKGNAERIAQAEARRLFD